jgi:hypothetical protein
MDDQGSCLSGDVTDVLVLWCFLLSEQGWSSSPENLNVETPVSSKKGITITNTSHAPKIVALPRHFHSGLGEPISPIPFPSHSVYLPIITFRSSSLVLLQPRNAPFLFAAH